MATFPSALPSYAGFIAGHTLAADNHASQHNSEQADITAIATKVGTGSSTPTNNSVLVGNGAGTSNWSQVNLTAMVSGVLPVANGGTGVSSSTGSGSTVLSTAPTISNLSVTSGIMTDTLTTSGDVIIGDDLTVTDDTVLGGDLSVAGPISGAGYSVATLYNPYKFRVYRNAALTSSGQNPIIFDTKTFDTGSNYSTVTGIFTVPVAGFYWFHAQTIQNTTTANIGVGLTIYQGANAVAADNHVVMYAGSYQDTQKCGSPIQCSANDQIKCVDSGNSGFAYNPGSASMIFSGFLVSAT